MSINTATRDFYVRMWREATRSAEILEAMYSKTKSDPERQALYDGFWWTKKQAEKYAERAALHGGLLMLVEP